MSDLSSPPPSEDEASIKRKITLTRNQVLFYMNQSVDVFPINTAGNLVKHNTLRHFLFSLAEKAPSQMMNLLEKTRKHALEALEKKKKVEKKEPVQIARKREAPVQEGLMQRIKRLKGDGADGRAEREFSRGMPSSVSGGLYLVSVAANVVFFAESVPWSAYRGCAATLHGVCWTSG